MTKIHDSTIKRYSFGDNHLSHGVLIGSAVGIGTAALFLTRGKISNLKNSDFGIKEVMTLSTCASLGGYLSANHIKKEVDKKARNRELVNQLLYNDFIPLIILHFADKLIKIKNKLIKSLILSGTVLVSTFASHTLADIEMKKHGIEKKFPVQIQHLIPELDDYLLPVAIVTKSKMLQQFLKILSPFTFIPMGYCIGTVKDDKYF